MKRICACLLTLIEAIAVGISAVPARADEVLIPAVQVHDDSKDAPKLFVIAIGAASFKDSFWPPLKWTERDAERVATAFGLNTGRKKVVTLLTGASATREATQKAFAEVARQARSRDAVAVYISTHGTLAIAGGGDLEPVLVLPETTSKELGRTGLPESMLRQLMDRVPARRKILILAACHSGLGKSRLTPRVQELLSGSKGRTAKLDEVSEGFLVLTAAARGETAREDDAFKGDVYTHYFLEALTSFDRNLDGAVSALEAHDYARDRAYARSGGRQRATLEAQAIGEADLVLQGRVTREALPVLEARGEELAGIVVSVDGGAKGRLPTAVALSRDKSRVQLYRTDQKKPFAVYDVSAPAGARVELEELLAGQPWSIGLALGVSALQDSAARRIVGRTVRRTEISGGYRFLPELGLGLALSTFKSDQRDLRQGIAAEIAWDAWEVYGEYVHSDWRGFDFGGGLALGDSHAVLNLTDSDDSMEFKSRSTTVAPYLFAGWNSTSGMALRLSARYTTGAYDFGTPGQVDARRTETMFGILYRFGGIARRK